MGATALTLAGCSGGTRVSNVPYDPPNFTAPNAQPASTMPSVAEALQPGDAVRVTVFQEPELSGEFRLDRTGRVDYPLLGQVQAQGLTPAELASALQKGLSARFIRNPRVNVSLTEAVERTITVDGAVGQPGVYKISDPITLVQAVALARGTKEDANQAGVLVFRNLNGQRTAAAFDLSAIRRAKATDPTIYPNDTVVVLDSRSRALYRDILQSIPLFAVFRPF